MSWSPLLPTSERSKRWMLPCSNRRSISLLWVTWFGKTVCQSWSHTISPLWLARGDQYPYLLLISLVCLFLSPQMIDLCTMVFPQLLLLFLHIRYFFITKIARPFFYLTFSAYFFLLDLIATLFMVTYIPSFGNIIICDYHAFFLVRGCIFCSPWL